MELWEASIVTLEHDFMFDYVSLANGSMMYKRELNINSNGDYPELVDGDDSMSYLRVCPVTHYIDPVSGLCQKCDESKGTTHALSTYCVDATIMNE